MTRRFKRNSVLDDTDMPDRKHIVLLLQTLNGSTGSTEAVCSKYPFFCRKNVHCLFYESVTSDSTSCTGQTEHGQILLFQLFENTVSGKQGFGIFIPWFLPYHWETRSWRKKHKCVLYSGYGFLIRKSIFSINFY